MGNTVVGIKTAQGEFFPILNPASGKKRRVVLVPSREEQENVKIQLYQQLEDDPGELIYLSSIFMENIGRNDAGERELELVLSADGEMNIYATAKDLVTGEIKSISVATRELGHGEYSIPTSEFDDQAGVVPVHDSVADADVSGSTERAGASSGEKYAAGQGGTPVRRGIRPMYLAAFVIAGLLVILTVAWLILKGTQPAESGTGTTVASLFAASAVEAGFSAFGRLFRC